MLCTKLYQKVKTVTSDREKALAYAKAFDFFKWCEELRGFLGKAAEPMIAQESKEGKYELDGHAARLDRILANWDRILTIIDEELPSAETIDALLASIQAPRDVEEIGIDAAILPMTVKAAKDIRDKYVLSRLLWDLGVLDEVC